MEERINTSCLYSGLSDNKLLFSLNQVRKVRYLFIFFLLIFSALFPFTKSNISITIAFLVANIVPLYVYQRFSRQMIEENEELFSNKHILNLFDEYNIFRREKEVIKLLIMGKTNKEIEEQLFISSHTVKNHIYNIFRKLNLKNRTQLGSLFYRLRV